MITEAPPSPLSPQLPLQGGLSLAERDRRYALVRRIMRAQQIDCLIFPHNTGDWDNFQPDARYLTCLGGGGMATSLVFPIEGEPIAAVREARRVAWWRNGQNWVRDVRHPQDFYWSRFFAEALRERGMAKARIGVVGLTDVLRDPEGVVSYTELATLKAALPNAQFVPATGLLYAARKRKSAEEIRLMEKAQVCADAVSRALREIARPGVTEHEAYAAMIAAHVRNGGESPTMVLFAAEKSIWQTQLLPIHRALESGDVIVIEADTKFLGYTAQAVDTVSLRPFSPIERRLFDVSIACFHHLLEAMQTGRSYADLVRLWEEFARSHGAYAGRTMGHGLGLGQDGPLTKPGSKTEDLTIEEGDCFVLKPWITDEGDKIAVRVGGTVVVEAQGVRRLGSYALEPAVVT